MAEVVERNIEDSLSEFTHIRRAKLFNEEEIRLVLFYRLFTANLLIMF